MNVQCAEPTDFDAIIAMAREVEPLFGPMADDEGFQMGLKQAIEQGVVFCSRQGEGAEATGAIIVSKEHNQILWFAVRKASRNMGAGKALLKRALEALDRSGDIYVQTFDSTLDEGAGARALYTAAGFDEFENGGENPAGVPTVILRLKA